MGRPSLYTESLGNEIALLLAEGLSLRQISERDDMPHRSTLVRWGVQIDDFAAKCARARPYQADSYVDRMDDVCCKVENGEMPGRDASVVLSSLQWRAEKLAPKKYSARLELDVGRKRSAEEYSSDELAEIIAAAGRNGAAPTEAGE